MKNIIIQFVLFCCMIPIIQAQNKIKQYEYWLDADYASRQTVPITPAQDLDLNTSIQLNGLKTGYHALNFRFLDTNNAYSAISTHYIEAFSANPQVSGYEYWFDDTFSYKTSVSITPSFAFNLTNLNVSSVSDGLHLLAIRFSDVAGKWSTVQYGKVFKSGGNITEANSISGYRYWLDSNFGSNMYKDMNVTSPGLNFNETVDLTAFPKGGSHVLSFQFKDKMGLWSTIQSTNLTNTGGGTVSFNVMSGYRYWMENDFANNLYKDINPALASVSIDEYIDLKSYNGNNRLLNVQFKDASGLWSPVITDTVNVQTNVGFDQIRYDRDNIQVYPNPNKGEFTISMNREIKDASLYITNSVGEILYIEHYNVLTSQLIHLNTLQPGIYFVHLVDSKSGKTLKATKMVIQQ